MAEAQVMRIEAEYRAPIGVAQLAHYQVPLMVDEGMQNLGGYRLDMTMTRRPANARGRYSRHWGPHRFERLGDVFMIPPDETLLIRCEPGVATSVVCEFSPDAVAQWLDGEIAWTGDLLQASLDLPSPAIRGLLGRLGEELRGPGFASEVMAELILGQIAIELARHGTRAAQATESGLTPWRLRLIDERLADGDGTASLSELAELCRLSVRHLTRGFRASRGCSIGEYVARLRIDAAKRRLAGGTSIKAIAGDLGFGSPASFTYAFRRATGMTPQAWRRQAVSGS